MATSTDTRREAAAPAPTGPQRLAPVVPPRGRRRPGLITAGVALSALGALVAVWLVSSAGDRTDVVVLARDVPYGAVITADDLTTTAVAVDPSVATVGATAGSTLIGQLATANLPAGSLLAPSDVAPTGPPGPGEVLVPLPATADRLPASGLRAGDRLLVVDTPTQAADPPTENPETFEVVVARVGSPDLNGVSVVDVVASAADGPAIAARAATGRFALVLLSHEEP
ncbi:SAF domain-containing protein [Actinotalea sp. AC32]|nr:SAF domain-containing protein [Actinotalea sp. AC32]